MKLCMHPLRTVPVIRPQRELKIESSLAMPPWYDYRFCDGSGVYRNAPELIVHECAV